MIHFSVKSSVVLFSMWMALQGCSGTQTCSTDADCGDPQLKCLSSKKLCYLQGLPGPQGAQGDKGDKGDKGEQGTQGAKGEQGAQGAKGEQGTQGTQGTQGDKGDSGVGLFCGFTINTKGRFVTATKTGFAAAKELCETVCGNKTARMCSGAEIAMSLQNGMNFDALLDQKKYPNPRTWVNGTMSAYVPNSQGAPTVVGNNCSGWTSDHATYPPGRYGGATPAQVGLTFARTSQAGDNVFVVEVCDEGLPIACCK